MSIDIVFPESVRKYMRLQCNMVENEYRAADDVETVADIIALKKPKTMLDLGAGIGRASMYIVKRFGWTDVDVFLCDGDTGDHQIAGINSDESSAYFYNSFAATRDFWAVNAKNNMMLMHGPSDNIKNDKHIKNGRKFDLVCSFRAIGFHWPCIGYLTELIDFINSGAYVIFEMRSLFCGAYPNQQRWNRAYRFSIDQIEDIKNLGYYDFVQWRESFRHRAFGIFRRR